MRAYGGSNVSDYAAAGKAAADSMAKTFAIQRKTGPDYGMLSQVAMKTAAEERITGMKAAANVTKAGINAYEGVVRQGNKIEVFNKEQDIKSKQKMAGGIAAIGKLAGVGFLSRERDRDPYPTNSGAKAALISESNKRRDGINAEEDSYFDSLDNGRSDGGKSTAGKATTVESTSSTTVKPVTNSSSTGNGSYNKTFQSVYDMAKNSGASYPALVAAQWKLESAGGTALSGKNNFFGIKATGSEAGTSKNTWEENSAGQAYNTSARFKDFESPEASVNELVSRWHKDYKNYSGVNNAGSRSDAARMLKSEGYATDSNYANKLIKIMSENGYS